MYSVDNWGLGSGLVVMFEFRSGTQVVCREENTTTNFTRKTSLYTYPYSIYLYTQTRASQIFKYTLREPKVISGSKHTTASHKHTLNMSSTFFAGSGHFQQHSDRKFLPPAASQSQHSIQWWRFPLGSPMFPCALLTPLTTDSVFSCLSMPGTHWGAVVGIQRRETMWGWTQPLFLAVATWQMSGCGILFLAELQRRTLF